jgi:ElaB/YqjD/DUF883 family membrane-anchored ribosome-binding protein
LPNDNFPDDNSLRDPASTIGRQVVDATREARASAADMARSAGAAAESGRVAAADRLAGAASTVRQHADDIPGGPRVHEFAHAAANRLSSTADYLRTSDATRMRSDVETMVKNNPGPALLVAAMFGFLLGRALTRD